MKPRRLLALLLSFAITAFFLVLALRHVDLAKLARAFATADYRLAGVAALCWFAGYAFRTMRWQRLIAPTRRVRLTRLFPVLVVGFALNNLLPGRPGEFARAYGLGAREGLSKTLSFATVVVERVTDGIAVVLFLLLAVAGLVSLHLELPSGVESAIAFSVALFGVALVGLVFLLLQERLALGWLQRITRYLPRTLAARVEKMLTSFVLGLGSLRSFGDLAIIALTTLVVWLLDSCAYFSMLGAFNALPFDESRVVAAVTLTATINLGIMIPAAPGGLGPYEAAGVFALGAFGVNATTAASVALAAHTIQYVMITGLGLFFIWREGISLVRANGESAETP